MNFSREKAVYLATVSLSGGRMRKLAYLIMLIALAGCSTAPKVPLSIVMPPPNDIQLAEVLNNPTKFVGADVRWGGGILKAQQYPDYLRVEVLQRSLNEEGEPLLEGGTSDGRFIVHIPGHYDAEKFRRNRFITVYGELTEPETVQINAQTEQELPVVSAREYYTWRVRADYDYYDPFYRSRYYWHPFYYPYGFYHPYPYRFYRPLRPPTYELYRQGGKNDQDNGNQTAPAETNNQ